MTRLKTMTKTTISPAACATSSRRHAASAENPVGDENRDSCCGQLLQHRHGERCAVTTHVQTGFNGLLEDLNVLLKLARQEFAGLGVDPLHIRDQRQQREQKQQRQAEGHVHRRTVSFATWDFGEVPGEMVLRLSVSASCFRGREASPFSERAINPSRKSEFSAQTSLEARHFAIVRLVIVA